MDLTKPYAVVVGGVNMDICAKSFAPLIEADSNPGTISYSVGGVGRNIAHNMALLGMKVTMLTAFGTDEYGREIERYCDKAGIDLSYALRVEDIKTSTYLYIAEPDGEMALAVSDMAVCDRITPDYLASHLDVINGAELVVLDANISAESMKYIASVCRVPVFCDPVSTTKAEKTRGILGSIHTFKPNRQEAETLSGIRIRNTEDALRAGETLRAMGVGRVFISMGENGVCAVTERGSEVIPSYVVHMVNTTGCGDAFTAGLAWACINNMDLDRTAAAGIAAASVAMETMSTINTGLCEEIVRERMEHIHES